MSQPRPDHLTIVSGINRGKRAVKAASETRQRYHRRRSPRRTPALEDARSRCEAAAEPLRSWLGMVAWGGIDQDDELAMKRIMEELRYERRQITKMLK